MVECPLSSSWNALSSWKGSQPPTNAFPSSFPPSVSLLQVTKRKFILFYFTLLQALLHSKLCRCWDKPKDVSGEVLFFFSFFFSRWLRNSFHHCNKIIWSWPLFFGLDATFYHRPVVLLFFVVIFICVIRKQKSRESLERMERGKMERKRCLSHRNISFVDDSGGNPGLAD